MKRANGMLLLGALGSMDPASGAEDSSPIPHLLALEQQAIEEGTLEHWLHALGNSGDPQAFEAALPYLEHSEASLRIPAAEAMRKLESPEAADALSKRALGDSDAGVRRTCAAILADRADALSVETVRELLEHEPLVDVRRAAVDALARRAATDPGAREILEYVSAHDSSAELRERAQAALE